MITQIYNLNSMNVHPVHFKIYYRKIYLSSRSQSLHPLLQAFYYFSFTAYSENAVWYELMFFPCSSSNGHWENSSDAIWQVQHLVFTIHPQIATEAFYLAEEQDLISTVPSAAEHRDIH